MKGLTNTLGAEQWLWQNPKRGDSQNPLQDRNCTMGRDQDPIMVGQRKVSWESHLNASRIGDEKSTGASLVRSSYEIDLMMWVLWTTFWTFNQLYLLSKAHRLQRGFSWNSPEALLPLLTNHLLSSTLRWFLLTFSPPSFNSRIPAFS